MFGRVLVLPLLFVGASAVAQTANPIFVSVPMDYLLLESAARASVINMPEIEMPDPLEGVPGIRRKKPRRYRPEPRNVISESLDCDSLTTQNATVAQLAKEIDNLRVRISLAAQSGNLDEAQALQEKSGWLSIVRDNKLVIAALMGNKRIEADIDLNAAGPAVSAVLTGASAAQYRIKPVELTYAGKTVTTVDTSSLYPSIANGPATVKLTSFDTCLDSSGYSLRDGRSFCMANAPRFHIVAPRREICTPTDADHQSIATVVLDYDTSVRVTFFVGPSPNVLTQDRVAEDAALNRVLDAKFKPIVLDIAGPANFAVDDELLKQYKVTKKEEARAALLLLRQKVSGGPAGQSYQDMVNRFSSPGLHYRLQGDLIHFDLAAGTAENSISMRREGPSFILALVTVEGRPVFKA